MSEFKRVAIISDTHCGHQTGLTPPDWQAIPSTEHTELNRKLYDFRVEAWEAYQRDVESLQDHRIDCVIANGDMKDGRSERQGGLETLHLDRNIQAKMAVKCIEIWEPRKVVIVRGTDYHTGQVEQWEDIIADTLSYKGIETKIGDHEWVDVNGFVFDCKHHIGGSTIPHGRYTAAAKEDLWNLLWNEAGLAPRGDMIVRSHVHYHIWGGRQVGTKEKWFMTTPGLQGWTRYGGKRCSGTVNWGFMAFDIDDSGKVIAWHKRISVLETMKAKVWKV
jgi:hypothetical protein